MLRSVRVGIIVALLAAGIGVVGSRVAAQDIIDVAATSAPAVQAAQSNTLTHDESVYVGKILAIGDLYQTTMAELARLTAGDATANWTDLTWQNDMIAEAGVLAALDAEMQAIDAPDRFQGSKAELDQAFAAADDAGHDLRQGIEQQSLDTFARAVAPLNEANAHIQTATELVKQEGGS